MYKITIEFLGTIGKWTKNSRFRKNKNWTWIENYRTRIWNSWNEICK